MPLVLYYIMKVLWILSLCDLVPVSVVFCIISYAWLALAKRKYELSAIFSILVPAIDLILHILKSLIGLHDLAIEPTIFHDGEKCFFSTNFSRLVYWIDLTLHIIGVSFLVQIVLAANTIFENETNLPISGCSAFWTRVHEINILSKDYWAHLER